MIAQQSNTFLSDEELNQIEITVGDHRFWAYTKRNEGEILDKVKALVKGELNPQPENKPEVVALVAMPKKRGPGRPKKNRNV